MANSGTNHKENIFHPYGLICVKKSALDMVMLGPFNEVF
jgi:hypothetical protein